MRPGSFGWFAPLAVLTIAVFLSACGGSDAQGPTPTPQSVTLGTPAQTPSTGARTPSPTPGLLVYAVKEGDTLGGIADQFNVSVDKIMQANGLTNEADLSIGQKLTIPGVTATPRPTPGPTTTSNNNLLGMHFAMPIAGACLTPDDDQMPNAPRDYRAGIHEGLDFFTSYACVDVPKDTPALAVADGTIVRADHDYRALTQRQIDDLEAQSAAQGYTSEGTLDKFRGRQVWIDHGHGIVTRYCHLNGVPQNIQVGQHVTQGETVGYVGDSGTPESASQPGYEIHLHFEIRLAGTYLGAGLDPAQTRAVYEAVFGIAAP